MKIINEKGKLFGIINVVDLLVLVAAIAVVAGVGYKLFAKQIKEVASPQVSLTMTVRVRGSTPFLVNEVQRNSQVGKSLVNGNSYVNAQITDMKIDDYNQQVTTADGRIVTATDPEKKDLVFTITTKVSKDTPAPAIGTQEVRAGRTFIVKTNDFETTGNIDSVDIADN